MAQKRVLSFGYERGLMTSRSMLLDHGGYIVEEAYSPQAALCLVQAGLVDLILICHTVPRSGQDLVIAAVQEHAHSIPILCINDSGFSVPPPERSVEVSSAPEELLAALSWALNQPRAMGYSAIPACAV